MSDVETAVRIDRLVVRLGGRTVIDGLDLAVGAGEFLVLLGRSGSGKTTLVRTVAGLAPAAAGTIDIFGTRVNDPAPRMPPDRRGLSLMFQNLALWPHMSLMEHVLFAQAAPDRAAAAALLRRLGIGALADRRPGEVSGGERQRAALARALAPAPRLLLLDEPWTSVDRVAGVVLRDLVTALCRERGLTVVMVTHDQEDAFAMGDRVAVLADGRIRQCGPPGEIWCRPADSFVAGFVGRGTLLPAETCGDGRVRTALGEFGAAGALGTPGALALLRPEMLRVDPGGGTLRAVVKSSVCLGGRWRIDLEVRGIRVEADHAERLEQGATIGLALPSDVWLVAPAGDAKDGGS